MQHMRTCIIRARVNDETAAGLAEQARAERRPLSAMARLVLEDWAEARRLAQQMAGRRKGGR